MASFIAPRSDEWEAMHPWGRAPLKHEIPRLAYSELYRHWFISNLTCPASPDVSFAAMIHCIRAARHRCSPIPLTPVTWAPWATGGIGRKIDRDGEQRVERGAEID